MADWRCGDAPARSAIHRPDDSEYNQRVPGRRIAAESERRSVAAGGRTDAHTLAQHRGLRESGAIHLRHRAALGLAWTRAGDDGPDARTTSGADGTRERRPPGRGVQPAESRE